MTISICGLDCEACQMKDQCAGCAESGCRPFGGTCMIALCCQEGKCENCGRCYEKCCRLKDDLIAEFNSLGIEDMEKVTGLNALHAGYINLEYLMPGGGKIKIWDDSRVILGNQMKKVGSDRCYGIAADEKYLMVCEYGENGSDPELVVLKRR